MDDTAWTREMKAEFERIGACAVYAAGPVALVPRRLGDNMGGRPVRLGTTTRWRDTISPNLDQGGYICEMRVLLRIWARTEAHAKHVIDLLMIGFDGHYDGLRNPWIDLGPQFDPQRLIMHVRNYETIVGCRLLTDPEMEAVVREKVSARMNDLDARHRRVIA